MTVGVYAICQMLSSVRSGWVGEQQAAGDGYWADNDCRLLEVHHHLEIMHLPNVSINTCTETFIFINTRWR